MSEKFLLPNRFKQPGWWILAFSLIAGMFISVTGYEASWLNMPVFAIWNVEPFGKSQWLQLVDANLTNTLIGVLFIAGALLVGFSKEKVEDEFVGKLRLSSLLWAVWINYGLLLLAFVFVYSLGFISVMLFNMFTVLIIFIVRFNYLLYKNNKAVPDEKYH